MSTSDTFIRATITKRTEMSNDLWVIRVDPGDPFAFTAGQYATLGVATAQGMVERAYSIVSSPYERELECWEKDAVKEERYFIPTPVHA